ncbi:MBL fold metallo-hydrolase [Actinokineospora globicatena]|nr:MBL fold metallo-hydrolase [Actinokineospora globicatena]GLW84662.1 MBL fold metallo-hydrolase [Actinokineospora globicatena]
MLTDPTFDPPGRRYGFGWGASSRKLTGPAISPAEVGRVDAVLLTHDHHADNLDDAGRALLAEVDTVITTVSGARRHGGGARGLRAWGTTRLTSPGRPEIEVTATPCRHGPPLSTPIVGDVVGFALAWPDQVHGALWCTGDTVPHRGLRQVARRVDVGTVLLHLGGVRFPLTGPIRYSMTARQAARLCGRIRPRTAIPVHYEGWQHFREPPETVERALADLPGIRWAPLGEPITVTV